MAELLHFTAADLDHARQELEGFMADLEDELDVPRGTLELMLLTCLGHGHCHHHHHPKGCDCE